RAERLLPVVLHPAEAPPHPEIRGLRALPRRPTCSHWTIRKNRRQQCPLRGRTFVLDCSDGRARGTAGRYPLRGDRVQVRPEPGEGHALQLVAQPVRRLRAPPRLLLRPRSRAARRPPP